MSLKAEYHRFAEAAQKKSVKPIHLEGHFSRFCTKCGSQSHTRDECAE